MSLGIVLQVLALLGGAGGVFVGLSILTGLVREYRFGYRRSESRSAVGVRLSTEMGTIIVWGIGVGSVITVFDFNSYTWPYFLKGVALSFWGVIGVGILWLGNEFRKTSTQFWLSRMFIGLGLLSEGVLLGLGLTGNFAGRFWDITDWSGLIIGESGILVLGIPFMWRFWKKYWEMAILGGSTRVRSRFVHRFGSLVETLLGVTSGSVVTVLVITHLFDIQQPLQEWTMFALAILAFYTFLVSAYYYVFLLGPISEPGYKVLLCRQDGQQWRVWLMDEDKKYYYIATSQEKARQIGCDVERNASKVVVVSIPKEEVRKIVFIHQDE